MVKARAALLTAGFVLAALARGNSIYIMAESFTPGYSALDMTVDLTMSDPYAPANSVQLQEDTGTFTGSWYFTRTRRGVHQIDLQAGALIHSIELRKSGVFFGYSEYSVPVYSRYNYNFTLFHDSFAYVGALAGAQGTSRSVEARSAGFHIRDSEATVSGLCGVGIGLKHFGDKWGFELGYDVLLNGVPDVAFEPGSLKLHTRIGYRIEQQVNLRAIVRF